MQSAPYRKFGRIGKHVYAKGLTSRAKGRNLGHGGSKMDLVSEKEAARLLQVSEATLRRWVQRKILVVYHTPTKRRRYKLSDINEMQTNITPVEVK
jgi:hypothetical protein